MKNRGRGPGRKAARRFRLSSIPWRPFVAVLLLLLGTFAPASAATFDHIVTEGKGLGQLDLSAPGVHRIRFRAFTGIGTLNLASSSADSLLFMPDAVSDSVLRIPSGTVLLRLEGIRAAVKLTGLAFQVPSGSAVLAGGTAAAPLRNLLVDSCLFFGEGVGSPLLSWKAGGGSKAQVARSFFTFDSLQASALDLAADTLVLANNLFRAQDSPDPRHFFVQAAPLGFLSLSHNTWVGSGLRAVGDGFSTRAEIRGNLFLLRSRKTAPLSLNLLEGLSAAEVTGNGRDAAYTAFDAGSYEASFPASGGNGTAASPSSPRGERWKWILPAEPNRGYGAGPLRRPFPFNVFPETDRMTVSLMNPASDDTAGPRLQVFFRRSPLPRFLAIRREEVLYGTALDTLRAALPGRNAADRGPAFTLAGPAMVDSLVLPEPWPDGLLGKRPFGLPVLVVLDSLDAGTGAAQNQFVQQPGTDSARPVFPNRRPTARVFIPAFAGQNTWRGGAIRVRGGVPSGYDLLFSKVVEPGRTVFFPPVQSVTETRLRTLFRGGGRLALAESTSAAAEGTLTLGFPGNADPAPFLAESVFVKVQGEAALVKAEAAGAGWRAQIPFRPKVEAFLVERLAAGRGADSVILSKTETVFTENADIGFQLKAEPLSPAAAAYPRLGNFASAYRFSWPGRAQNRGETVKLFFAAPPPGLKVFVGEGPEPETLATMPRGNGFQVVLDRAQEGRPVFLAEPFPLPAGIRQDFDRGSDRVTGLLSRKPGDLRFTPLAAGPPDAPAGPFRFLTGRRIEARNLEVEGSYEVSLPEVPPLRRDSLLFFTSSDGRRWDPAPVVAGEGRFRFTVNAPAAPTAAGSSPLTFLAAVEKVAFKGLKDSVLAAPFKVRVKSEAGLHLDIAVRSAAEVAPLDADMDGMTEAVSLTAAGLGPRDTIWLFNTKSAGANKLFSARGGNRNDTLPNADSLTVKGDGTWYFLATRYNIAKGIPYAPFRENGVEVRGLLALSPGSLSFRPGAGRPDRKAVERPLAGLVQDASFAAEKPYSLRIPILPPDSLDRVRVFWRDSAGWSPVRPDSLSAEAVVLSGILPRVKEIQVLEEHNLPEGVESFAYALPAAARGRSGGTLVLEFATRLARPYHLEYRPLEVNPGGGPGAPVDGAGPENGATGAGGDGAGPGTEADEAGREVRAFLDFTAALPAPLRLLPPFFLRIPALREAIGLSVRLDREEAEAQFYAFENGDLTPLQTRVAGTLVTAEGRFDAGRLLVLLQARPREAAEPFRPAAGTAGPGSGAAFGGALSLAGARLAFQPWKLDTADRNRVGFYRFETASIGADGSVRVTSSEFKPLSQEAALDLDPARAYAYRTEWKGPSGVETFPREDWRPLEGWHIAAAEARKRAPRFLRHVWSLAGFSAAGRLGDFMSAGGAALSGSGGGGAGAGAGGRSAPGAEDGNSPGRSGGWTEAELQFRTLEPKDASTHWVDPGLGADSRVEAGAAYLLSRRYADFRVNLRETALSGSALEKDTLRFPRGGWVLFANPYPFPLPVRAIENLSELGEVLTLGNALERDSLFRAELEKKGETREGNALLWRRLAEWEGKSKQGELPALYRYEPVTVLRPFQGYCVDLKGGTALRFNPFLLLDTPAVASAASLPAAKTVRAAGAEKARGADKAPAWLRIRLGHGLLEHSVTLYTKGLFRETGAAPDFSAGAKAGKGAGPEAGLRLGEGGLFRPVADLEEVEIPLEGFAGEASRARLDLEFPPFPGGRGNRKALLLDRLQGRVVEAEPGDPEGEGEGPGKGGNARILFRVPLERGENAFRLLIGEAEFLERETAAFRLSLPSLLLLGQNHPNPARSFTTLAYEIPAGLGAVRKRSLIVTDLTGRLLWKHPLEDYRTGRHRIRLDTSKWPRGFAVYRLELETAEGRTFRRERRMLLQ